MLLFSREVQLTGSRIREAMALATHLAEYVTQTNGVPVELWTPVYSPQVSTLTYTAFIEDMTGLEAAMDKLMVDDGYHDLVEKSLQYAVPGSVHDALGTIVHPAQFPTEMEPISYARVIASTVRVNRLRDAVELGAEIAARCQATTGASTLFLIEETGPFVGVSWIYGHADAAAAERFNVTVSEDSGLMELMVRTGDLFISGASTRTLYRKVL